MQKDFENFAQQVDDRVSRFPLSLVLGFFVHLVYDQWKDIFDNIGFIDGPALFTCTYIKGHDAETRSLRKTIMRYICLSQVLVLRNISPRIGERYPSLDAMERSGYVTAEEKEQLSKLGDFEKDCWTPINWACELVMRAREAGKLATGPLANGLFKEISSFQIKLRELIECHEIPIPLAYPQMAFLAVRSYFFLLCFSRQFRIHEPDTNDRN
ncbi:bestrophin family protein [Aphelenchoides avenae]|nr:bestrophin family protein [Aphelenchus avenae]